MLSNRLRSTLRSSSFATNCNPFTFCPAQLCEGPVFPTVIMMCNGTSVGTLTTYTSRCVKHNLEIDWVELFARPPFYYSTFPIFICSNSNIKRPLKAPPHWWGVTISITLFLRKKEVWIKYGQEQELLSSEGSGTSIKSQTWSSTRNKRSLLREEGSLYNIYI